MSIRPIILDQHQLTPFYQIYRQTLCAKNMGLDDRLRRGSMQRIDRFLELASEYDLILLDAFGVLNRGSTAIPGAAETIATLRGRGQAYLVVSNNASQSPARLEENLRQMGFDFQLDQIISSGMATPVFIEASVYRGLPYFLVGSQESLEAYAPTPERLVVNGPDATLDRLLEASFILFCSDRDYYGTLQQSQLDSLLERVQKPILLANPDLVTPSKTDGLSVVAGYTATLLAQRFGLEVVGIGKPFSPIFALALKKFPDISPERVLMVGDTLDTDILGGAAMGFATCLTLSGVYANQEDHLEALCDIRGIRPDFVVASIAD
ncbi:MAG: TIGR01459 family HAD-type hydrolase [Magnetococcus sp. DMHC-6]